MTAANKCVSITVRWALHCSGSSGVFFSSGEMQVASQNSNMNHTLNTDKCLFYTRNVSFENAILADSVYLFCSDVAGQFVSAVQLRGGDRLRLSGEVPGTRRPVHQCGSVPVIRCSFSEGWTLVPHGLSLSIWIFGRTAIPGPSGCYEVWKYSGAMFVSFLAADARRVGQGGEKGEAASSHTASLKRERGIAGIGFQIGVGDLIALRKQRESPGQTINQVACFGWFLPCTRYLSHPMAQNQILLVKVKPPCT